MNDRFNQLLKQVEEETNAEYQDESRRKRRLYNEILLPKFAELIVRECIGIVEGISPGYKDYRDQIEDAFRRDCVEEIKQHFGVEE